MKWKKKGRVSLMVLLVVLIGSISYYLIVNKNSRNMTGKQKVMKALYPLVTGVTRLFGRNSEVLINKEMKSPATSIYHVPVKLNTGNQLNLNDLAGKKY